MFVNQNLPVLLLSTTIPWTFERSLLSHYGRLYHYLRDDMHLHLTAEVPPYTGSLEFCDWLGVHGHARRIGCHRCNEQLQ